MSAVTVVWLKELLDTVRDRRTLTAMVIAPVLVMPLLMILPQWLVRQQTEAQKTAVLRVAVAGAEHGAGLVSFLAGQGVELIRTDDPAAAVRRGEAVVGLRIAPGFERAVAASQPAGLTLGADESKTTAATQVGRVQGLLQAYGQMVVAQRLASLGVDPAVLRPFDVARVNLATPREMGGVFLGMMLPLFIVLWALVGGMYTAIDVTAGEKERLTLEPLLTTPAARVHVVAGKFLAVVTTSLAAMVLAVASMTAGFVLAESLFATDGAPLAFHVTPLTALLVLLAALPVVLMFSALEMAVCIFARSFKEAQNYLMPLQFAVVLPVMAIVVAPTMEPVLATYAIPVFGPIAVLRSVFQGTVTGAQFGVMLGASAVYAAGALALALHLFQREQVLFRT